MSDYNNTTLESLKGQNDTINLINPAKNDQVLIVRNDEGFFGLEFAKHVNHVIIVDSRESSLERLNNKIQDQKVTNIETQLVDIENFQFNENSFDVILARASLRHFSNPINVLKKINSLLKPNGKFLLYEMSFPTELKKLFESLSFIIHGELAYYWNYNEIIQMLRETEFVPYLIRPTEYISNKTLRRVESEDLKRKIKDMLFNLDDKSKKLLRFKRENESFTMYYETYDILSTKKG